MSTTKVNISTALGTTFAWYDFLIFNIAVALVFPKLFFTGMGFLVPILVFTVGFFARPLGALIYGIFSDVFGRKRALVSTLYVTGISTVLIGLLPTYEQIGVIAAVLLVILRITQTIAFGGEWAAASTLMAESNSGRPNCGLISSLVSSGWAVASIMAAFSFMAVTSFGDTFFLDYGWRIPFLLSGLLLVIGVYIRKRVSESPIFLEFNKQQQQKTNPLKTLVSAHRMSVLYGALTMGLSAAWTYVITVFGVSYMLQQELISRAEISEIQFLLAWIFLAALLFYGWLGDKIGQKKLFVFSFISSLILAFPIMHWILNGEAFLALLSLVLVMCPAFASAPKLFTSIFPTEVRTIGSGVSYNLSLFVAALVTIASQLILDITDNIMLLGIPFLFLTAVAFIALMQIKKEYQ